MDSSQNIISQQKPESFSYRQHPMQPLQSEEMVPRVTASPLVNSPYVKDDANGTWVDAKAHINHADAHRQAKNTKTNGYDHPHSYPQRNPQEIDHRYTYDHNHGNGHGIGHHNVPDNANAADYDEIHGASSNACDVLEHTQPQHHDKLGNGDVDDDNDDNEDEGVEDNLDHCSDNHQDKNLEVHGLSSDGINLQSSRVLSSMNMTSQNAHASSLRQGFNSSCNSPKYRRSHGWNKNRTPQNHPISQAEQRSNHHQPGIQSSPYQQQQQLSKQQQQQLSKQQQQQLSKQQQQQLSKQQQQQVQRLHNHPQNQEQSQHEQHFVTITTFGSSPLIQQQYGDNLQAHMIPNLNSQLAYMPGPFDGKFPFQLLSPQNNSSQFVQPLRPPHISHLPAMQQQQLSQQLLLCYTSLGPFSWNSSPAGPFASVSQSSPVSSLMSLGESPPYFSSFPQVTRFSSAENFSQNPLQHPYLEHPNGYFKNTPKFQASSFLGSPGEVHSSSYSSSPLSTSQYQDHHLDLYFQNLNVQQYDGAASSSQTSFLHQYPQTRSEIFYDYPSFAMPTKSASSMPRDNNFHQRRQHQQHQQHQHFHQSQYVGQKCYPGTPFLEQNTVSHGNTFNLSIPNRDSYSPMNSHSHYYYTFRSQWNDRHKLSYDDDYRYEQDHEYHHHENTHGSKISRNMILIPSHETMASWSGREAAFHALYYSVHKVRFIMDMLHMWSAATRKYHLDFGLAQTIACQACRRARSLDYAAEVLVEKTVNLNVVQRIIMRLSLAQFLYLERLPAYAIVNESVNLAKKYGGNTFSKFLNALLRKIATMKKDSAWRIPVLPISKYLKTTRLNEYAMMNEPECRNLIQNMGIEFSYPDIFVEWLLVDYPLKTVQTILDAGNSLPSFMVRIRGDVKLTLGEDIKEVDISKAVSEIRGSSKEPFVKMISLHSFHQHLEYYSSASFFVQNATPVALILGALKQISDMSQVKKVLDICAGPGNMTILLADVFPEASITAHDLGGHKLKWLWDTIEKYKMEDRVEVRSDGSSNWNSCYDVILVDVPNSNSGILVRRAEARWRLDSDALLSYFTDTQLELLENTIPLLRQDNPEAQIWYSTHSVLRRENEQLVEKACEKLQLKKIWSQLLLPNNEGWDGGYIACLKMKQNP